LNTASDDRALRDLDLAATAAMAACAAEHRLLAAADRPTIQVPISYNSTSIADRD